MRNRRELTRPGYPGRGRGGGGKLYRHHPAAQPGLNRGRGRRTRGTYEDWVPDMALWSFVMVMGIAIANPAQAARRKTSNGDEDGVEEGKVEGERHWTVRRVVVRGREGWTVARPGNAVTHTNLALRYFRYHTCSPPCGGEGGNWTGYSLRRAGRTLGVVGVNPSYADTRGPYLQYRVFCTGCGSGCQ